MDVGAWLRGLGLGRYEAAFLENDVDSRTLPDLTAEDLKEIGVASVGHRRLILQAIAALDAVPAGAAAEAAAELAPAVPRAERRQLTVMFADLVGSTELSRRLDPEEMGGVIRAYQDVAAGEVGRLGGHVAQYLGDGVLAYFGWPRAYEDAAERAVRAGLAAAAAVAGLRAPDGAPLAARVGIATGPVVVGDHAGRGEARDPAAVGEVPNLAARLQGLAEPGAVVVAERTRRLLRDLFAYRDLGTVGLKGFAEPVRAWVVAGEGAAEGRFEALHGAAARLAPLVGREHELALLLDRWEQAKEGEGQVVLLSGEAGIGKSRLVRALRERLDGEPHTPLGQFCSPQHANTALHPAVGLLERAAGLRRGDPPERQLEALEAVFASATAAPREAAAILADLLAIPVPAGRYPPLALSPQRRKELTFQVLLDQVAGLAAERPVLAFCEDAHWADPTTLELVSRVIEQAQRLPVLMLVTFRPEFAAPWAGHGHVTLLSLGRLGRRQGGAVVGRVAGGKPMPPEVLERILALTDGVPLFVEELTKAVLESGLLSDRGDRYELDGPLPPLAIPATLQDSLAARLDHLAPVKGVAQFAACIGREFPRDLLAAVAGVGDDELEDALGRLVDAGMVFRRGGPGPAEASYAFKHALVRDAAYRSLLRGRRQQLHARIAAVLEERFPEAASGRPELLAHHHAGAGSAERAARCWQKAAELAIGRSANAEAAVHCEEALARLATLPPSPERARAELAIQLAKGGAVRAGKGYVAPEAERAFLRACDLCEELGDPVRLVHALRGMFGFYYVAGRWEDAARIAARVASATDGLEDATALMLRWFMDGVTVLFRGEPAEAVPRLREALRRHDEGDRDGHVRQLGVDMATLIRAHAALAHWLTGLFGQAARASDDALELARRLASPFPLAQALANIALLRLLARDWAGAEALAAEAREVGVRLGLADYVAFGAAVAGTAIAAGGDVARGTDLARDGLAGLRRTGWGCVVPLLLAQLAAALAADGDADAAAATADEAVRTVRANGELCWEAEALRAAGEAARAAGPGGQADAEAHLRAAVEVARRQGARALELRAAASLARLWAERGEGGRARDLLAPVLGSFTEGLDTPDLRDAAALLGTLR